MAHKVDVFEFDLSEAEPKKIKVGTFTLRDGVITCDNPTLVEEARHGYSNPQRFDDPSVKRIVDLTDGMDFMEALQFIFRGSVTMASEVITVEEETETNA